MLPDMEEVDVGEPDEAKKDPFNSDKASMLAWLGIPHCSCLLIPFVPDQHNDCTCTEAKPSGSVSPIWNGRR